MARSSRRAAGAAHVMAQFRAQPRGANLKEKVRGLMVMVIGGIVVGYGTGSLSVTLTGTLAGLSLLLIGFTWLME